MYGQSKTRGPTPLPPPHGAVTTPAITFLLRYQPAGLLVVRSGRRLGSRLASVVPFAIVLPALVLEPLLTTLGPIAGDEQPALTRKAQAEAMA